VDAGVDEHGRSGKLQKKGRMTQKANVHALHIRVPSIKIKEREKEIVCFQEKTPPRIKNEFNYYDRLC
jgi:hypothetical protein